MSKGGRGILKLADYFREALNPCMACGDKIVHGCKDCKETGRQSSEQKKNVFRLKRSDG